MRVQLLAPILVATIGLTVLGFVQTTGAVADAADAQRAKVLASTAVGTVQLVHEVERELAETTALRQRGGKAGLQLVTAQRQRTDAAVENYLRVASEARETVAELDSVIRLASGALDNLPTARATAMEASSGSAKAYQALSTALLNVADALPTRVKDPELANRARVVAALSAVEHYDALQRALVRVVFARKQVEPGELGAVATLVGMRKERLAEFERVADQTERTMFTTVVKGDDVDSATHMLESLLNSEKDSSGAKTDPDAWYTSQSNMIRRINLVTVRLSDRLEQTAADVELSALQKAWGTGVGTAALALAALMTAVVLAVRTSRRLRRLRAAALTVARRELPDAILAVTTGTMPGGEEPGPSAAAMTRALASANDEIGQVADAFASVHRTALQLAGEQAELRVDVARMAEILARRIRTLITRQLRLLDEFEREETDPDVLARLFALDHLAARLRRNGENLLVLAGGEPGRSYTQPFPLAAVVTAAASEIEDFARVEATVGDVMIASGAVADVVRVLAELLENAATFSPPHTPVRVDARRTIDGAVVRVHDSGIGITAARLGEINARLAQPASLTSAAAGTMGLHVVSHLTARHGIRVQLHPTGTGTVAYVMLPHSTLITQAALAAQAAQASKAAQRSQTGPRSVPLEVKAPSRQALSAAQPGAVSSPAQGAGWETTQRGSQPAGAFVAFAPSHQRQGGIDDVDRFGAKVEAASQQPTAWFRPYAGTGEDGAETATCVPTPVVWAVPSPEPSDDQSRMPVQRSVPSDAQAASPMTPALPYPPAQMPQRAPNPESNGSDDSRGLPRRNPGALLAPEVSASQHVPARPVDMVDPETVRARLSAFAEGVSAASRRVALPSPVTKDR